MNEIIILKNIELKLKKTCVFQNLNFSCKQGEIIGITGANGSGKSVLFNPNHSYLSQLDVTYKTPDLMSHFLPPHE
ncbi:ATP-binding cassette domain-containing protein, partial [Streptococcus pneumoniae]